MSANENMVLSSACASKSLTMTPPTLPGACKSTFLLDRSLEVCWSTVIHVAKTTSDQ